MTRGRLPSGSYIEAGSHYRTRGGDVVQVIEVRETGLRAFGELKDLIMPVCQTADGGRYGVFWDGAYRASRRSPEDLVRRAFPDLGRK